MKRAAAFTISLLVASTVLGAEYQVEWEGLFRGTVDTEANTLQINERLSDVLPDNWGSTWYAVRNSPDGHGCDPMWNVCPPLPEYDIPDDWDGTFAGMLEDGSYPSGYGYYGWGFLPSRDMYATTEDGIIPGISVLYVSPKLLNFTQDWTLRTFRAGGVYDPIVNYIIPSRIDVQPISPSRLVGDVNLDGLFDSGDFVCVFRAGKYETGNPAAWPDGDWTGDGLFNSGDLVSAFVAGAYESPAIVAAAVPEPTSVALLLIAILSVASIRRLSDARSITETHYDI